MGGHRGKRARPPGDCTGCKEPIRGSGFYRLKDGDYCLGCGEKKIKEEAKK